MGVRYVVLPTARARVAARAPRRRPGLRRTHRRQQLDLAQLRTVAGIVLYENLAYAPIAVGGARGHQVPTGSRDPNRRRA